MAVTVGLVACAKSKAAGPRPAAELYTSPLFRKAAAYCRRHYDRWFILSALHGLVEPGTVLAPYDRTLLKMTRAERQAWARRVVADLERRGLRHARFFLHGGRAYAGVLTNQLDCACPLAGLGVGERLAWYTRRTMKRDVLRVPALEVRQGGRKLYAFAVDGKVLHRFAAVSRLGRTEEGIIRGYQRPEVLAHVAQIRAYLETDDAILPNSIVLAFHREVLFRSIAGEGGVARSGELTIPLAEDDADKVAWIVDGQQRAAAVRELTRAAFPVCVTAFVARDVNEQRAQFLLVNNTRPLPKGLVYELLPGTDALLPERLAKQRFPAYLLDRLNGDGDSPLKGRIRTATAPEGLVKDTSVLAMLNHSLTDGVLYRFRNGPSGDPDVEAMLAVLKDYWAAVAAVFPEAWARPPRLSRLTHGAGFVALGFVMEDIVEQFHHEGLPGRTRFEEELSRLTPYCHWTPESGDWDLGGVRRRWHEFQNTPKDTRLLASLLCRAYRRFFRGRLLRLSSYGDPAAVPLPVWKSVCEVAAGWVGYTHQFRTCDPGYARYCMASCETVADRRLALRLGYRTFRVRLPEQPLDEGEFVCPASAEGGARLTCAECRACAGAGGGRDASPCVVVHESPCVPYKARRYRAALASLPPGRNRRINLL